MAPWKRDFYFATVPENIKLVEWKDGSKLGR
jgi:hypothetical protein